MSRSGLPSSDEFLVQLHLCSEFGPAFSGPAFLVVDPSYNNTKDNLQINEKAWGLKTF